MLQNVMLKSFSEIAGYCILQAKDILTMLLDEVEGTNQLVESCKIYLTEIVSKINFAPTSDQEIMKLLFEYRQLQICLHLIFCILAEVYNTPLLL